jgi:hypothetical protein
LDDFQAGTSKDIAFMSNDEFLKALKKYIERIRGMSYEEYESVV